MATRIRLSRGGSKKSPFYRIVVADKRSPRDGNFIEKLGTYNPLLEDGNPLKIVLKSERVKYWLGTGAEPSERVAKFLVAAGLHTLSKKDAAILAKRSKISQEAVAKKKAEEAAKAAEEAAKAAAEAAEKAAAEKAAAEEAAKAAAEQAASSETSSAAAE